MATENTPAPSITAIAVAAAITAAQGSTDPIALDLTELDVEEGLALLHLQAREDGLRMGVSRFTGNPLWPGGPGWRVDVTTFKP